MQTCNTLNIVTNSNGIVRVYADGGMVFEIQSNYVKTESFVDCHKPAVSGTVPKARKDEEKPVQPVAESKGRIMLDESDFTPMSAEEKWRRANWDIQPEAQYERMLKHR